MTVTVRDSRGEELTPVTSESTHTHDMMTMHSVLRLCFETITKYMMMNQLIESDQLMMQHLRRGEHT